MERFMGKIVGKPNLIADDRLNAKIEKIFNVEAFQRMVENADVFSDVSQLGNSSMMNILKKQGGSFKKVLPTHSQMQDDDEDMLEEDAPRFGTTPLTKEINESMN